MGFVVALCLLRVVRPELVRDFAERHDSSPWTCMCEILRVDPSECSARARNSATLPLRWAVRTSGPASRASWADALAMIKQRPEVSHRIIGELEGNPTTPNLRALADTHQDTDRSARV